MLSRHGKIPLWTVKQPAQSNQKRHKVFQTEKQHSRSTDPHRAHEALHGNSKDIENFSQTKGL